MFINASTKEFALVNNAIPSYYIAFEHLLYNRLAPPMNEADITLITIENFHRYNIQYQLKSNVHSSLTCCEL